MRSDSKVSRFHLLLRHFVFIIYSIRKKGKGASPAHGAAPSFFPSQGRTLPQSEEAEENPRESLFSPISSSQKRMPFGILSPLFIGVFLFVHPMRHAAADQQKEQQDETRAVFLKINEIMAQDHLDHDRGDLADERRLEMLLR